MANSTSIVPLLVTVCFVLLVVVKTQSSQQQYQAGRLACKTHHLTLLDCHNRSLVDIPELHQNLTTVLDLSHNLLRRVTGEPFINLSRLIELDLSKNLIANLSSSSFKGLLNLRELNLEDNELTTIPKGTFEPLHNLHHMALRHNILCASAIQEIAKLPSIRYLKLDSQFLNPQLHPEIPAFNGFQNLTQLSALFFVGVFDSPNGGSDLLKPVGDLPLVTLSIFLYTLTNNNTLYLPITYDEAIFEPTCQVLLLFTSFYSLPALNSMCSPYLLGLVLTDSYPVLNETTLSVLQRWDFSLIDLTITEGSVYRIEDYSFRWTPNLIYLFVGNNRISVITNRAFSGLRELEQIILENNVLTEVPSKAFSVFQQYGTLQKLDLSKNPILPDGLNYNTFKALSSVLRELKLSTNLVSRVFSTQWLKPLQNLQRVEITVLATTIGAILILEQPATSLSELYILKGPGSGFVHYVIVHETLCDLFPNLRIAKIYNAQINKAFEVLPSLARCPKLSDLDFSGSVENIILPTSINMSILNSLALARNKFTSLEQILSIIAPNLERLDLSHNLISAVNKELSQAYPKLTHFNIADNLLTSLSGLENLLYITDLIANTNRITTVPAWLISRTNDSQLQILDLSDNPFKCGCDIEPFRKWIQSDNVTWLIPGRYDCTTPKSLKGMPISFITLDCKPKTAFYVGISILLFILLCICIYLVVHYRWHINYMIFLVYRNIRPAVEDNDEVEMIDFDYHVYVAYNDESAADDAWVKNHLQPNLEEGPEPMMLCIKHRDFRPGRSIIDNISNGIQSSRKTILILSPHFVESEWCYHEMQMAQMRLLDDELDVLVLVLLEDIPEVRITMRLRQLLCKKDYLKWPQDRPGQRLFWQRLRQEIKGTVHIDRCLNI